MFAIRHTQAFVSCQSRKQVAEPGHAKEMNLPDDSFNPPFAIPRGLVHMRDLAQGRRMQDQAMIARRRIRVAQLA